MSSVDMPIAPNFSHYHETTARNRAQVRAWLYFVVVALLALVLVGGATRLTDSGLSITQWKPLHGAIPPLNVTEWQEEFELYKKIPEYTQINEGMTLNEFKTIFWWEWAHRFLARSIGLIFALPLAFFWITGRLEQRIKPKLVGILALGALQGAIGWWMVSSGLTKRVDVSQYRLAVHLIMACLIFATTLYVARALAPHHGQPAQRATLNGARIFTVLIFVQIYLGALVAGLDAGLSYNTWPLMDGAIIPGDLFVQNPAWLNLFENPKTVQFLHRCGAYLVFAFAFAHMIACFIREGASTHSNRAAVLFVLVSLQMTFGIITLVLQVPLKWGLIHQGMAMIVLGFCVAHWRGCIGAFKMQN